MQRASSMPEGVYGGTVLGTTFPNSNKNKREDPLLHGDKPVKFLFTAR